MPINKRLLSFTEPTQWVLATQVQEQHGLAEALGGIHQLLPVLL